MNYKYDKEFEEDLKRLKETEIKEKRENIVCAVIGTMAICGLGLVKFLKGRR